MEELKKWEINFQSTDIKECIANRDTPACEDDIFNAFKGLPPEKVKVLIIGQDPYPDVDRAHGLAFSFKNNQKAEDSLQNIFNKIEKDLGIANKNTNLECWRDRGVLLLNTALTYKKGEQDKHIKIWKTFVNKIISKLLNIKRDENNPLVIMLWGGYANLLEDFRDDKEDVIRRKNNIYILRASHPSNLGKNYKGNFKTVANKNKCQPLSKNVKSFSDDNNKIFIECNDILKSNKIDWSTD